MEKEALSDILTRAMQADGLTLLQMFYRHQLEDICGAVYTKEASTQYLSLCDRLLYCMAETPIKAIVDSLRNSFEPYPIEAKDIPQFSDLDVCILKVPIILVNAQLEGVCYNQMGFMLRTEKRSEMADKKYGENQAKTAAMMCLCTMDADNLFWPNILGYCYSRLPDVERERLYPYLSLHIPMMQNCVIGGRSADDQMASLAESTRIRRMPNVKRLISLISNRLV